MQKFYSIVTSKNIDIDSDNNDTDQGEIISTPTKILNPTTKEITEPTNIINTKIGKKIQMSKSSATRIHLKEANPNTPLRQKKLLPKGSEFKYHYKLAYVIIASFQNFFIEVYEHEREASKTATAERASNIVYSRYIYPNLSKCFN